MPASASAAQSSCSSGSHFKIERKSSTLSLSDIAGNLTAPTAISEASGILLPSARRSHFGHETDIFEVSFSSTMEAAPVPVLTSIPALVFCKPSGIPPRRAADMGKSELLLPWPFKPKIRATLSAMISASAHPIKFLIVAFMVILPNYPIHRCRQFAERQPAPVLFQIPKLPRTQPQRFLVRHLSAQFPFFQLLLLPQNHL